MAFLLSLRYDFGRRFPSGLVGCIDGCYIAARQAPEAVQSMWFWRPNQSAKDWTPVFINSSSGLAIRSPGGVVSSPSNPATLTIVMIPTWIPMSVALMMAWFFHRKARLPRFGHCAKCGYNLSGNESGVCPECGTKT
jgi:hypothetical protein